MTRGPPFLLGCILLVIGLSGCIDQVELSVQGVTDQDQWSPGGGTTLHCPGGKEVTLTVHNHDQHVHHLDASHWRMVFGAGSSVEPTVVQGAQEVAPDGKAALTLWGCDRSDDQASLSRILLHKMDPDDDHDAPIIASVDL